MLLDQYGRPIATEKPAVQQKKERPPVDETKEPPEEPQEERSVCSMCRSGEIMMSCEDCRPGQF